MLFQLENVCLKCILLTFYTKANSPGPQLSPNSAATLTLSQPNDSEQCMWDSLEPVCSKCQGPGVTVGHGSSQHVTQPNPFQAQNDCHGKCCSSKKYNYKPPLKV